MSAAVRLDLDGLEALQKAAAEAGMETMQIPLEPNDLDSQEALLEKATREVSNRLLEGVGP